MSQSVYYFPSVVINAFYSDEVEPNYNFYEDISYSKPEMSLELLADMKNSNIDEFLSYIEDFDITELLCMSSTVSDDIWYSFYEYIDFDEELLYKHKLIPIEIIDCSLFFGILNMDYVLKYYNPTDEYINYAFESQHIKSLSQFDGILNNVGIKYMLKYIDMNKLLTENPSLINTSDFFETYMNYINFYDERLYESCIIPKEIINNPKYWSIIPIYYAFMYYPISIEYTEYIYKELSTNYVKYVKIFKNKRMTHDESGIFKYNVFQYFWDICISQTSPHISKAIKDSIIYKINKEVHGIDGYVPKNFLRIKNVEKNLKRIIGIDGVVNRTNNILNDFLPATLKHDLKNAVLNSKDINEVNQLIQNDNFNKEKFELYDDDIDIIMQNINYKDAQLILVYKLWNIIITNKHHNLSTTCIEKYKDYINCKHPIIKKMLLRDL